MEHLQLVRPPVSPALVRILADMVEAALTGHGEQIAEEPCAATRRRRTPRGGGAA